VSTSAGVGGVVAMNDRDALVGELRDARDLIVQLQRELERAREVIADQQRTIVRAVVRARTQSRRSE
jgi:hypothetical protein